MRGTSQNVRSAVGFTLQSLHLVLVTLASISLSGGGGAVAAEMPERDTTHHDRLDDLNFATGEGGSNLGNGESVHSFNGNLQIVHATSPSYPVDGGGRFGLVRTYNSNAVVHDDVYNNGLTVRGVSWAGLGWKLHMGRFFSVPEYKAGTTPKYKKKRYYFETPTGALIDVVWEPTRSRYKYQTRPAPEIYAEYFPDCGSQLPPVCDDGLSPPCEDNAPAPESGCPERSPEDQGEHYRVIFPGGTVYKLEKRVGYQYTGNGYLKNADRAGFYTTRITDPAGNAIYVSYDNANSRFPEAITRVWSSARPGVGDMDIQLRPASPAIRHRSALSDPKGRSSGSSPPASKGNEARRRPPSSTIRTR